MRILNQGNHFCTVDRYGDDSIRCKTVILSTEFEAMAYLVAETNGYIVKEAGWEIQRAKDKSLLGYGLLPELIGCEAYFNAGKMIRGLKVTEITDTMKELLLECVRGIIQSETYLYMERGYKDRDDYIETWNRSNIGTCLHYSNLDKRTMTWFEYIGDHMRTQNLFNRYKNFTISDEGEESGSIRINGTFSDSFHEMNASFILSKNTGAIEKCEMSLLRAPGPCCYELSGYSERLIHSEISSLTKKKIAGLLGGGSGCFHFVDLITDMVASFNQFYDS